jgi:hypothetical protein
LKVQFNGSIRDIGQCFGWKASEERGALQCRDSIPSHGLLRNIPRETAKKGATL